MRLEGFLFANQRASAIGFIEHDGEPKPRPLAGE